MPGVNFSRNRVRLKKLLGIRTRLALLAVLLVAPLMLDRVRTLEASHARQLAQISEEFANLTARSADTLREVVSSVETVLKSAAYIRASVGGIGRSCEILRASVPVNMPWIYGVLWVGGDGRIQCSTDGGFVGVDLSDRPYLKKARETRQFVMSDFILARPKKTPVVVAAYPVSAMNGDGDSVVIATVNLDWMSRNMANLGGRPGISAVLVDGAGTVLAAPADESSLIGRSLNSIPLMSAIEQRALDTSDATGSFAFTAADGSPRAVSFAQIPEHNRDWSSPSTKPR